MAWLAYVAGPQFEELLAGFGGRPELYPLATNVFLSTCTCWGLIPLGLAVYWLGLPADSQKHYRIVAGFGRVSLTVMIVLFLAGAYGWMPTKLGSIDAVRTVAPSVEGKGLAESCR